jgi:hypothetical protein
MVSVKRVPPDADVKSGSRRLNKRGGFYQELLEAGCKYESKTYATNGSSVNSKDKGHRQLMM